MTEETPKTEEKGFMSGLNKALPIANWVFNLAMFIGIALLASHDSAKDQTTQINEIKAGQQQLKETIETRKTERDKQFDEIKKIMLSRDVFEAYHSNDVQRMERIEKTLEQLAERPR